MVLEEDPFDPTGQTPELPTEPARRYRCQDCDFEVGIADAMTPPELQHEGERGDPVHQCDGKWWFWSETWADRLGPFDSEEECRRAVIDYARSL